MDIIKREVNQVSEIAGRFKRKDFSGNEGQAIKNSSYHLATNLVAKIGSIFFTIIIARLLMPELFGLYGLALSTILLFSIFSDLGITKTFLTFAAKNFGDGKGSKVKSYFNVLLKYKLFLIILLSIALLASSYFIANNYYNKPIFFALLAGLIYIPANNITVYFASVFISKNNFKINLIKEVMVQAIRIILVPITIILFLGKISNELLIFLIIISLSISYIVAAIFFYIKLKGFRKIGQASLNTKEKVELKKFLLPLSVTALSGTFFGSIDIIMLGHFVSSIFIGYYQAAFSLVGAGTALLAFSSGALLPIFSRLKKKKLERGLRKSLGVISIVSISSAVITFIFADIIISLIYGASYAPAVSLLRILSLILICIPLIGVYSSYYISQGKTGIFASLLLTSTTINIFLNYFFITSLLSEGMFAATIGAAIATVISKYIYLFSLIIFRKK